MSQYKNTIRFDDVDHDNKPIQFVNYLDQVSALESVQRFKRQSFVMLNAREVTHLLDVACGNGDDVRALAQFVGSRGKVVGVDRSETMIAEARRRSGGINLQVEFRVDNIYHLEFASNTFDGARSDRVFQHLDNVKQALAEMIRVVKSNGKVVVADSDKETLVIDASNRALTRRILNYLCDRDHNGWSGASGPNLTVRTKTLKMREIEL